MKNPAETMKSIAPSETLQLINKIIYRFDAKKTHWHPWAVEVASCQQSTAPRNRHTAPVHKQGISNSGYIFRCGKFALQKWDALSPNLARLERKLYEFKLRSKSVFNYPMVQNHGNEESWILLPCGKPTGSNCKPTSLGYMSSTRLWSAEFIHCLHLPTSRRAKAWNCCYCQKSHSLLDTKYLNGNSKIPSILKPQ